MREWRTVFGAGLVVPNAAVLGAAVPMSLALELRRLTGKLWLPEGHAATGWPLPLRVMLRRSSGNLSCESEFSSNR